ncbi:VPS35 endosomal protein-sorting factor-like [Diorhabda sublineata]|uniref:VPS35 endosomal protein-sorting factor-like n=1 Tax=Diorhabda sublineata TaxID=1163346 RepID=UPI0024E125E6|nr:VPS35 endosomal protein-sorting factor-like [Diorhabda sublineata]
MTENIVEWKTSIPCHNIAIKSPLIPVSEHPLKSIVTERLARRILGPISGNDGTPFSNNPISLLEPLTLALKQLDPLSEFALQEMDPLSKMAAEANYELSLPKNKSKDFENNLFHQIEPWHSRRTSILNKYTTSEKLSIITSFLSEGDKVTVKAQSTVVDKVQYRLKQLDSFEEGSQQKLDLSQAEYISKIEQLNKELVMAWNTEQRVKALKIAIQCAKLLGDTEVLHFYPSKFVLITDILDTFGKLVFDRLRTKSTYVKPGSITPTSLPDDFTPDMVPDTAKETCLNWFYKIASIRELVPRLYIEIALLNSYRFISTHECAESLNRMTNMINGIGNPLVAVYVRCYLCKVGITISNEKSDFGFLLGNFTGFLDTYQHLFSRSVKRELDKQNMPISSYMTLYTPALDFILETINCVVNETYLPNLLAVCRKQKNSSLILNTIMSGFKPVYVSERTLEFLGIINECSDGGVPLYILLRTLGLCVTISPPPIEQRKDILNIVWGYIGSFTEPNEYVACVEAWVPFVVQCFTSRELNYVLGDIIEHLTPNRNFEKHYNELKIIISKIVAQFQDFEMLLIMDNFLPIVDLFQEECVRVEVCKNILTTCNGQYKTNDPVITNALMFLCGILHDSVNALTPEGEYKQIGEIVCNILRKVNYGRDFEKQLNFFVEARATFSNIDTVLVELVQQVNTLSVNTRQIVKGMHTRKTGDFVRACAAYCFITIPSILSTKVRLELYLVSAQVAIFNQCLGQADACLKAALSIIPDLEDSPSKPESFIVAYIKKFLSVLLVVPDNPDRGVLGLTRSLLNVIRQLDWDKQACNLGLLYINVLDLLSVFAQEEYPYHADKVESNDALYGSDPKFINEINNMCSIIVREILNLLKDLGNCRKQVQIAIELFVRIAIRSDLDIKQTNTLALNLWQLCSRSGYADSEYMVKTKEYLKRRSEITNNRQLHLLVDKLVT